MNEKTMYIEFASKMFKLLCNEVNGKIQYELYPEVDVVIFKILFKDFDFSYAINNVQDHIYNCTADAVVADFKEKYKRAIFNAFFKNGRKKGEAYGIREA